MQEGKDPIKSLGIEAGKLLSAHWRARGIQKDLEKKGDLRLLEKTTTLLRTLESILNWEAQQWTEAVKTEDLEKFYRGVLEGVAQSQVRFGFLPRHFSEYLPGYPKFQEAVEGIDQGKVFEDDSAHCDFFGENETGKLMVELMLNFVNQRAAQKREQLSQRSASKILAEVVAAIPAK